MYRRAACSQVGLPEIGPQKSPDRQRFGLFAFLLLAVSVFTNTVWVYKRGAKVDELYLTPLELIDRIAAFVPPPRTHRHRYFGVLAPNSPLRAAITAMAAPVQAISAQPAQTDTVAGLPAVAPLGSAVLPTPEPAPAKRTAHYLWAVLIARIYEVFPLLCPLCGGQMRIIAFIAHSADIRHILDHIGVESEPPHSAPARGPPL